MGTGAGVRRWAGIWMLVGMLMAGHARASMEPVEPGEVPALAANQGLVLVAVDTNVDLYGVRVNRDGKSFGAGVMRDIKAGRSFRLYVAPAGKYEWRELQLFYGLRYALGDDEDFHFTVEPGRITYPGELVFRPVSLWRADIATSNRGLAALDWLQKEHPSLYATHPFVFAGRYPDPFPAFYKQASAQHPRPPGDAAGKSPADPGPLPVPVKTLFRPDRILQASLNPAGSLLALHVRNADDDWAVELVDLKSGSLTVMAKSALRFESLEWSGDETLLIALDKPRSLKMITVIRIETDVAGKRSYARIKLPRDGVVVDSLPRERDHILFGSVSRDGEFMVHKLDISSQKAVDDFRITVRGRMNTGVTGDVGWYTDGEGNLRLAMVRKEDEYVLLHGRDGTYTEVMKLSDNTDFQPVGISYDANLIYGLTDKDRDQRDLVEYDVTRKTIVRTVFSRAGVDVVAGIFNAQRVPIGVQYYQGGQLVNEYFQSQDVHMDGLLRKAFPGRMVSVMDRSRDGRQSVLRVDAADQPPQIYHLDSTAGRVSLVDESMPWLSGTRFARAQVMRFKGSDGLSMEAFLTLPPGDGKRPLVVFPHGGPIGVADRLHFDREVQFIASLGYAVLQVNFRGSEGYGKAFREAGYRNYGKLIEDDIDAALREALAKYPLDAQRMCVLGASYGGYSALVATVRWPERFRCAVSIAGVSDRILFFTASDSARSEKTRALMEKMMGNPKQDLAEMQQTSPLYQFESIRVPVMLAHGLEDPRVDFEHTRRMARMLTLAGHAPVELSFEKEGHGIDVPENQEKLWSGVAAFLRQHLGNPLPGAASVVPAGRTETPQ
ncbi:prolyl oligopeptidase family serine peptidase [Pseudoxanthomonas sp. SL93]|uniref:alpha/beta hydrolase family protein n=1 Tax=Pseudoxanthomonas sp. SL93 TaxID=2995142 RepID=UPI00226D8482|nr:prolyl oligopeptidase family serine peptidase [Pseudoxanthomonas sp. SL93]WAC64251.1 prolyl oligopeptidase family serine peptidase [Pseudoxanthomonas sp. SL93]